MAEYPFANTANASSSTELPLFKEWAWNFEEDHFIYDENGNHILLEGNEALKCGVIRHSAQNAICTRLTAEISE